MDTTTATTTTSVRLRNLALYAFAVFGWELVVTLLLDGVIRGAAGDDWAPAVHWAVTAAGWGVGAVLLLRAEPWVPAGVGGGTDTWGRGRRVAAGAAALALAVGVRAVLTGEWKPAAEVARLHDDVGAAAFPVSLAALVVYYLAEVVVIVLLLGYGQRWGEATWGRPQVPWGGLALACTWGAAHLLLQGPAGGVYAMGAAMLYGVLLLAVRGRFAPTYVLVAAAFLL
jgi:hypothetical protein